MNLSEKDKQIAEHIMRYCEEVKMALSTFGANNTIFNKKRLIRSGFYDLALAYQSLHF